VPVPTTPHLARATWSRTQPVSAIHWRQPRVRFRTPQLVLVTLPAFQAQATSLQRLSRVVRLAVQASVTTVVKRTGVTRLVSQYVLVPVLIDGARSVVTLLVVVQAQAVSVRRALGTVLVASQAQLPSQSRLVRGLHPAVQQAVAAVAATAGQKSLVLLLATQAVSVRVVTAVSRWYLLARDCIWLHRVGP